MKGYKSIILLVFVLAIIITTGQLIKNYLDKSTAKILSELNIIESSISSDEWTDAQTRINNLTKSWNNTSQKWSAFTNHHEIDNITVSFKSTEEYIKNKEKSDSLTSLEVLKHYIYHIPLMEKISIENIF